jgi:tetraacyldisaccharide 4'-kinase
VETSCQVLKGKPVVALAGVGRPQSFASLLERIGARIVETRFFPDHHDYCREDLEGLHPKAPIVTTEKDAVKLKSLKLNDKNILVLPITLTIEQEKDFFTSLKKCLPSLA